MTELIKTKSQKFPLHRAVYIPVLPAYVVLEA